MIITKEEIISLLKTHINYISVLILFVGLMLKFALPNLAPFLNNLDIAFFGELLIGFSVLLYLGNFFINKYRDEINEQLFSKILDEKLGIKNSPLLTELENLQSPFSYNLTLYEINCHVKKAKNNSKKYDIFETRIIKLNPKQDNIHYIFSLGSTEKNNAPQVKSIKIDGKKVLKKEVRLIDYPYMGGDLIKTYQILTPLKKGREYTLEIDCFYPSCMSDLTSKQESDSHEICYFALTERTVLRYEYDFDNFEDYEFRVEKRHMNIPDINVIPHQQPNKKERKIVVESGNLKNGDRICITYTKNNPSL